MEWEWYVFTDGPLFKLNIVISFIIITLSFYFVVTLISRRNNEKIARMGNSINSILFLSLCLIFLTFMNFYYDMLKAYSSIAESGTGDPKVIIGGILEWLFSIQFFMALASFFLIVWFLLRAFHRILIDRVKHID